MPNRQGIKGRNYEKFKGSQINFKVWPNFFQNQRIGESECANHNGATENFKWNKGCQIYMGKNKGFQKFGLFWGKHSGRVFPIKNDRPLSEYGLLPQ